MPRLARGHSTAATAEGKGEIAHYCVFVGRLSFPFLWQCCNLVFLSVHSSLPRSFHVFLPSSSRSCLAFLPPSIPSIVFFLPCRKPYLPPRLYRSRPCGTRDGGVNSAAGLLRIISFDILTEPRQPGPSSPAGGHRRGREPRAGEEPVLGASRRTVGKCSVF